MTTAIDVITGALKFIEAINPEIPIEASMAKDGLDTLNDLGVEWELIYGLGFEPVTVPATDIQIPRYSVAAFKTELGMRLAPILGISTTPEMQRVTKDSRNSLRRQAVTIGRVQMPETVPRGSGNRCPDFIDNIFFPPNKRVNF